ncbi:MAG: hypothetical protein M0P66_00915 [Salinivirgaceae bacterium]|nr:hypothetical protein [Salinivirgaceae bacterium]
METFRSAPLLMSVCKQVKYEIYRKFVSNSLNTERTTVHFSDNLSRSSGNKKKIALPEKQTVTKGSLTPNSSLITRYQIDDYM